MNNVDMDYEMSLMAKNQLKYNTMIQQMNSEFKKMRTVIRREVITNEAYKWI